MSDVLRLLQRRRVARAADGHRRRVGADAFRHPARDVRVEVVVRARDERDRHLELAEPVPQRRLDPLPEHAQLVRESRRAVAPAVVELRELAGKRREQRLCEPAFEERADALAFDLEREPFVMRPPRFPRPGVRDAGRRAHEHEALDDVGAVECEHEAKPATHRVPDVGRLSAPRADRRRGRLEVESLGDLERGDVEIGWQVLHDRVPRRRRLREPVDEHQSHVVILP